MLHMNYNLNSDLGLSVRAQPFKNVFELFHVKTSLRELNRKLSNDERFWTIKSSLYRPLASICFISNYCRGMECSPFIQI